MGAAHPACPQCHGAAHLAVVRVEKHACVLPRERFNVCATSCVHTHTHGHTASATLEKLAGGWRAGSGRRCPWLPVLQQGRQLPPGPRSPSQGAEVTARAALPAGRIWAECHTMGSFSCSAALLPPRERERSPAHPSPPPLPWGAMSHPPHLPAPMLPLALGHTCLLPRRTVLIWGTVGASLKGETLSRPALCCRLKSQQNTQHWWHPWGLLHVLPGRATIFPRGAFLGRRQASTPAPRTVFLHSWAVTAPRCGRLCSARCVWSWTDTAGRAGAGGNRSTCIHQQELC